MSSDQTKDADPKKPVDQEMDGGGTDSAQGENIPEQVSEEPCTIQPIVEYLQFFRHCEAQYAEQKDCAVPKGNDQMNREVFDLISRAKSGELTIGEIEKLKIAAEGNGLQLSHDERREYQHYADSRGQTLQECLQILSEINCFVRVIRVEEFITEERHAGMIDHYARIPLFVPTALANGDIMRSDTGQAYIVQIIELQAQELTAHAKACGNWPKETAGSVAKALLTRYSSMLRDCEHFFATNSKPHVRPQTPSYFTNALKRANEAACSLLKNTICVSYVEKAHFDAICTWLRETKADFPPQLPWDAPKNIHEGLELLMDRLGLPGQPPAAVTEAQTPAVSLHEPNANTGEPGHTPESPAQYPFPQPVASVGKLAIIEWNRTLKYSGEPFEISGEERWKDIRALVDANGEYVKLEKGFPQRFAHDDALRFKRLATEAEGKGKKGTGCYRIKP